MTRFMHFSEFYPIHIQQLYSKHPDLAQQPFDGQQRRILGSGFHWANYLSEVLSPYGYEAVLYITNAEALQKQWARENSISYSQQNWQFETALAQARAFQPNVIFTNLAPEFVKLAREQVPSIRLIFGWAGEPIVDAERFREHDLVLTCVPENVDYYRAAGLKSDLLQHAFYPQTLERMKDDPPPVEKIDVGFIGNMAYGDHSHTQRAYLMQAMSEQMPLTLFGDIADLGDPPDQEIGLKAQLRRTYFGALAKLSHAGMGQLVKRLPRGRFIQRREDRHRHKPVFDALQVIARPPVFGLDMYRLLASFRISLNAHAWSAYASNMRLYEATGVGSLLLTDWKQNIADLFEPDSEVITYASVPEAVEKVRYLLGHEEERRAIAEAGQRRTLRDHTVAHRAAHLHELIQKYLP